MSQDKSKDKQAAVERIRQAAAEAIAAGRYMVGIFYEKDGKLICWSELNRFPEVGVDQSLEHLRRKAKAGIAVPCFLPDNEELRHLHLTAPILPKPGA